MTNTHNYSNQTKKLSSKITAIVCMTIWSDDFL